VQSPPAAAAAVAVTSLSHKQLLSLSCDDGLQTTQYCDSKRQSHKFGKKDG